MSRPSEIARIYGRCSGSTRSASFFFRRGSSKSSQYRLAVTWISIAVESNDCRAYFHTHGAQHEDAASSQQHTAHISVISRMYPSSSLLGYSTHTFLCALPTTPRDLGLSPTDIQSIIHPLAMPKKKEDEIKRPTHSVKSFTAGRLPARALTTAGDPQSPRP